MTKIDQYESVFRSADKPVYTYQRIEPERILVVSDFVDEAARGFLEQVRRFLSVLDEGGPEWAHLDGDAFETVATLLDAVSARRPDLIVTYRHLHSEAWHWPYSLGEYLDVLTQATQIPILVLPHPEAGHSLPHSLLDTDCVMAITDHLAGDDPLVNWALRLTQSGGTCWLTHVESGPGLDRILEAISKIAELDTEQANTLIPAQLLKEPADYIRRCRDLIEAQQIPTRIEEIIAIGHRLSEYRRLVDAHEVDLLVMHTMDGDQLAMRGSAYPLAVELRQIPLLML
ncbi:MAG: hypothetical protein GY910_09800 [bacterium]|nr:hypothetical protein [Deltaproteobacteria bacterium]MCP4905261.1 hypothetical protein [bacterium]